MRARLVWNRSAVGYRSVLAQKPNNSALTSQEPRRAAGGRQSRQPMRAQVGLVSLHYWESLGIGAEAKEQCPCAQGAPVGSAWSAGLESLGCWVPLGIGTEAKEQCSCAPGAPVGSAWSAGLVSLHHWESLGIGTETKGQCPCAPGAPVGSAWSAEPTANACASWSGIATPLGTARYRSCGAVV